MKGAIRIMTGETSFIAKGIFASRFGEEAGASFCAPTMRLAMAEEMS
jgi:hypothetical protein